MKKLLLPLTSKHRLLSVTALMLLISICVSCNTTDADPPDQTYARSTALTTTERAAVITSADSDKTTAPLTTNAQTNAPETSASVTSTPPISDPPETESALDRLQSVITDTPRDAEYISVYDLTDSRLLYSTGEDQQIYPASTTKLFSVLYSLTVTDENAVFTVGDEITIAPYDSSKAWIVKGQELTVRDLIAAMLLPSGNDAAYTLAVGCGKIIAKDDSLSAVVALGIFMDGMNRYADRLGLTGSHFVTPDGYHDPDHYTTLRDMTEIACMAYSNPLMSEIMAMTTYTAKPLNGGKAMEWKNTNLLLWDGTEYYFPSANGMKTGYHSNAGVCLIASAEQNGRTLIVLLFKGSDKAGRFSEAQSIFEACFSIMDA